MSSAKNHRNFADSIAIINPGSSSLKCATVNLSDLSAPENQKQYNPGALTESIISFLTEFPVPVCCVRFVHGGPDFFQPVVVDNTVFTALAQLADLAPLHNPVSHECLSIVRENFPDTTLVAVFDTEFFQHIPSLAQAYGLPIALKDKHRLRRYGFHGFAHAGMTMEWQTVAQQHRPQSSRLITIQLGSGCSMAAIVDGKAIETSMGFTPNDGLLMSTRTGDIDPGLVTWLQKKEHWSAEQTDDFLNAQSGWSGMTQLGANMADLLQSSSPEAALAVSLFCYRIRKLLGAYFAILGKLDGVILSGGIAEHSPSLCLRVLKDLEHLGISLSSDNLLVQKAGEQDSIRLSSAQSVVSCWVVKAKESRAIADSFVNSGLSHIAEN